MYLFKIKDARVQYDGAMSDKDKLIAAMSKVMVKHEVLINSLSMQVIDHAFLLKNLLPKCDRCDEAPAAVKDLANRQILCDVCAGVLVANGQVQEKYVEDLQDAEKIRHLDECVKLIKEVDDSSEPGPVH